MSLFRKVINLLGKEVFFVVVVVIRRFYIDFTATLISILKWMVVLIGWKVFPSMSFNLQFLCFFCCAHFDWMSRFVCQSLENNFIILISLSCFIWLSKPYMEPLLLLLLLFRLPLFWIFSNFRQFFTIFFVQLKNRSEWISLKIFHTIIMIFLLPNSKSTCEFKQFSFIFFQQNNKGKLVSN